MSGLVARVREFAGQHEMFPAEGAIIAAVSGGPDSMALLECVAELLGDAARSRLVVAHLDHGLRATAARDAEFVRGEAARRGLRFVAGSEDVKALARTEGRSVEDAARKARYGFLARAARDCAAGTIALGHTADDQAETVLLRLFRGAGIRGLAAMRPVRELAPGLRLVRPLLRETRASILEFLSARGVTFREDESNQDLRFRRNRVRHELLPLVRRTLQPRATEVLCRLAELARDAADALERQALTACGSFIGSSRPGEPLALPLEILRSLPEAVRAEALRLAFEKVSGGTLLGSAHLAAVAALRCGGVAMLPGGWRAVAGSTSLELVPPEASQARRAERRPWLVEFDIPGQVALPDGRILSAHVLARPAQEGPPRLRDPASTEEWADYEGLGRPKRLVARSRRPGDVFRPLGYPGARSVKRFLIDAKIPRPERERTVVVAAGAEGPIVWLAPFRLDERSRLTQSTREVLVLAIRDA